MDRAVLIGQGKELNVAAALGQAGPPVASAPRTPETSVTMPIESLDVVMRRHIESALRETLGRVEGPHGVARLLKINPHTLRARMRKLEIDWRRFRVTDE